VLLTPAPHAGGRLALPAPASRCAPRNVKRFREGLVFKAHRILYPSTLGLREIKKRRSASRRCRANMAHTRHSGLGLPVKVLKILQEVPSSLVDAAGSCANRGGLVFEAHRLLYHSA